MSEKYNPPATWRTSPRKSTVACFYRRTYLLILHSKKFDHRLSRRSGMHLFRR